MKHIALFLVDRQFPGVTLGKRIDKLGVRASATGEIILDDVFVPEEHLLGGETGGVEKVGTILSEIRVMTGALSIGRRLSGRRDGRVTGETVRMGSWPPRTRATSPAR